MSDRIKQLAMQADVWCDQNVAQGSIAYNNQWEHKFAELIVRECLSTIENSEGDSDYAIWKIKKDFGVE